MLGLKIRQGYESVPMVKFNWLHQFNLKSYINKKKPLVMFGCYKPQDLLVIRRHIAPVVIVWMGKDSLKAKWNKIKEFKNVIHTTWLPNVHTLINQAGIKCYMLRMPVKETPLPTPMPLGVNVYSYLQKGKPEYHGSELVAQLNIKHPLLIGTHNISRQLWYAGENNKMYARVFIGLALGGYAGGGMSILEMGVRGIPVVTNVLDLPHTIKWETLSDVERIIEEQAVNIGSINKELAQRVNAALVHNLKCFDLKKLII